MSPGSDSAERWTVQIDSYDGEQPRHGLFLDCVHHDFEQDNADALLFILPVIENEALVLRSVKERNDIFQRLGVWHTTPELMSRILQVQNNEGAQYPCEKYEDGKHTYKLV